ncbi:hypothetical protein G7Z17_g5696 [Cylindrodendrum hubeiense]|uniref:BTB domain-containing protein n=1 Tax=Cylindrodendrum hubeiense TaxID=595255 RepID=A0A9P5HAC7_9HYPO|nr:hypothetical protein G7Z17_g5696 [Cylindrodendrum hubeiense]
MVTPAFDSPTLVATPLTVTNATIEFDPAGDLYLTVGTTSPQEMLVDSRALSRSSTVFRAMLSVKFSEAKPDKGRWEVKLPEDSPIAFAQLMDMAHAVYEQPYDKFMLSDIFELCVLTNKYDMARVLRPMAPRWLERYFPSNALVDPRIPRCLMQCLFVAWETGHHKLLKAVVKKLAWNVRVNENNELIDPEGMRLLDYPYISLTHTLDTVASYRQHCLTIFDDSCHDVMEKLFQSAQVESFCNQTNYYMSHTHQNGPAVLGDIIQRSYKLNLKSMINKAVAVVDQWLQYWHPFVNAARRSSCYQIGKKRS